MGLSDDQLLAVIERAPLVSIDLVLRDADGRILLGRRNHEPAKDTWFVPGGRIQQGESLDGAFARIAQAELGARLTRAPGR